MSLRTSPPRMDEASFRAAMGGFATGVTVICVRDAQDRPAGFTASSLASVSLDPPLILFCLGRTAFAQPAFDGVESFSVNVLAVDQVDVSRAFARDPRAWFAHGAWSAGASGAPLIAGRLAGLECDIERIDEGGDHLIYLGRVRRADWDPTLEPLIHFRGRYRALRKLRSAQRVARRA